MDTYNDQADWLLTSVFCFLSGSEAEVSQVDCQQQQQQRPLWLPGASVLQYFGNEEYLVKRDGAEEEQQSSCLRPAPDGEHYLSMQVRQVPTVEFSYPLTCHV